MKSISTKSIAPASPVMRIPASLKTLATSLYCNLTAAREAEKTARMAREQAVRAQAELLSQMREAGLDQFDFSTDLGKGRLILTAQIGEGRAVSSVDVRRLAKLVDTETFLNTVQATQDSVIRKCGEDILAQVRRTHPGAETVSVAPKK